MFVILPLGHERTQVRRIPWVTIAIIVLCLLQQLRATFSDGVESELEQLQSRVAAIEREVVEEHAPPGEIDNPQVQRDIVAAFRRGEFESDDPRLADIERLEEEVLVVAGRDPVLGMGYRPGRDGPAKMLTSAFAHGGWLHLFGNMLFLYLSGINLEDRWGRAAFAGLYLAAAVVSAFTFKLWHPGSMTPLIGASGAVAACMGAFLILFARTRIRFFYGYWILMRPRVGTFEAPAYAALILWFVWQGLAAWIETFAEMQTAYSAHVGGFLFGVAVAGALKLSGLDQRLEEKAEQKSELFSEDAEYVRAMRLLGEGNKTGAADALRGVLADDPGHDGAREALFGLALELGDERRLAIDANWGLARAVANGEHGQAVGAYYTIRDGFPGIAMDDRALASVVEAAMRMSNLQLTVDATRELMTKFPKSPLIPAAMLHAASAQRGSGRMDLARKTLNNLLASYPEHPAAAQAREKLEQGFIPGAGAAPGAGTDSPVERA